MKLETAIEILTAILEIGVHEGHPNHEAAILLGIEALKRIIETRQTGVWAAREGMPGETEE